MNKLIITLFLLVSSVAAGAQMRWGVEGGVNVSHAFDTEKTKAGFNIGAVGEYSFSSHWFMDQPAIRQHNTLVFRHISRATE